MEQCEKRLEGHENVGIKRVFLHQKNNHTDNPHDIYTVYRRNSLANFSFLSPIKRVFLQRKNNRTDNPHDICTVDYGEDEKGDAQVSESRTVETIEQCEKRLEGHENIGIKRVFLQQKNNRTDNPHSICTVDYREDEKGDGMFFSDFRINEVHLTDFPYSRL
jgi:hypothetical protein